MADRTEELYRRFGPVLYARCRRLLGDAAAADDAVQEVFLRVLRHLEKVPDDGEAVKWLYRVSTNYCLNVIRDHKRHTNLLQERPLRPLSAPEQALLDKDLVRRLLNHVPDKLQAPAVLYYLDDMEQKEIAEVLGVSRRTVINLLNRFVALAKSRFSRTGSSGERA